MIYEVYSDGSATTADKPGGCGWVICRDGEKIQEGSSHLEKATNNVAEITAAVSGLEAVLAITGRLDERDNGSNASGHVCVVLVSDSQLVLGYANGSFQCRKPHLVPLYCRIRQLYKKLNAETRWVRGHTGDVHNERCDELAKFARNAKNSSDQGSTLLDKDAFKA